ncbi:MAG: hypothetical protein HY362_02425 [Candidatus Aenigmarchaeota archaeon]|nr:hypothetical protein [Candidatus Aenigmarchaeota archaeon]
MAKRYSKSGRHSVRHAKYRIGHAHQDPSIPVAMLGIVVSLFVAFSVASSFFQPTAYVVSGGEEYVIDSGSAGGSPSDSSSSDYSGIATYTDEPVGEASSSDYTAVFGPLSSGDSTPPVPQNTTQDKTLPNVGEAVTFSVEWEDDSGLDRAVVFIDEGAGFQQAKIITLTGTRATATYTWSGSVPKDTVVKWKMIGYDTSDNSAESDVGSFTIGGKDTVAPTIKDATATPEEPVIGDSILLFATVEDNVGLKKAQLVVGGNVVQTADIGGKTKTVVKFKYDTSKLKAGAKINWKITVEDGAGLKTESGSFSLTVKAAPIGTTTTLSTEESTTTGSVPDTTSTLPKGGLSTEVLLPLIIIIAAVAVAGGLGYYIYSRKHTATVEKLPIQSKR